MPKRIQFFFSPEYSSVPHSTRILDVLLSMNRSLLGRIQCYRRNNYSKCKGTAFPFQAWSGPKGSKKLSFPDFMTTAQDGGIIIIIIIIIIIR